jgi:hypothetical protein
MHKTLLLRRKLCTKKIRRLESSMEALEKFLQVEETRKKGKSGELCTFAGTSAGRLVAV